MAKNTGKNRSKKGRPSKLSHELIEKICARIISGDSLNRICKDEEYPEKVTIYRWLMKGSEKESEQIFKNFCNQYAQAREAQIEAKIDEVFEIADDGTNDWNPKIDKEGNQIGWQVNNEHIQRSRLRIDTIKWVACKLKPKKYGDKLETENHTIIELPESELVPYEPAE